MSSLKRELNEIARQLQFLANEGHGGSEARLVRTLSENSRRLQRIATLAVKHEPRPKLPRSSVVSYSVLLIKLVYDLFSSLPL